VFSSEKERKEYKERKTDREIDAAVALFVGALLVVGFIGKTISDVSKQPDGDAARQNQKPEEAQPSYSRGYIPPGR